MPRDSHVAPPLSPEQVLADEFRLLHPEQDPAPADAQRAHADAGHTALCFSGGGIRSASFNLGVLQGLAEAGILDTVDYLSTVSGGGYIGGWFSAWRLRAAQRGDRDPCVQLTTGPEPAAVTRLREFIKFLDPRAGWLAADTWTLAGTILRNLLVTWLLLIPTLGAAVIIPRLYFGVLGLPSQPALIPNTALIAWYGFDAIPILVGVTIASTYAAHELPSLGNRALGTRSFLAWFLTPIVLVEILFSIHRYWGGWFHLPNSLGNEIAVASIGMVLPWVLGGAVSGRFWRPWTWIAAAAAAALGRVLASWVHGFLAREAYAHPAHFAVYDLPIALALLFLQFSVFVGLASRDLSDEDREWWARAAAWILIAATVWLVVGTISILAPVWLDHLVKDLSISYGSERAGASVLTALSGASAYWLSARRSVEGGTWKTLQSAALALIAPLSVALLVVLVSDGDRVLLEGIHRLDIFHEMPHPVGASLPEDVLALLILTLAATLLGRLISSTQFSLHDMYRSRLVRTFLGASRLARERSPSRFTGFDAGDELRIDALAAAGRPLHIVNATMDLVGDRNIKVEQTKAASFTMTALHSGSRDTGYRPSSDYAAGLTLGQAITTSGAAVSPNMGASSSPALTFLLAMLNARLGLWLGNPGRPGEKTWTLRTPAFGLTNLVNEMLGRTTDKSRYVYLSDGGHFENLALYEVVARRCRYVVVSDAGCDAAYCFDDLANAIRRVRIDFGIPIEFPRGVDIGSGHSISNWAVGAIRYSAVDPLAEDGILLYLKPALTGNEPIDVLNYARSHAAFPQESTMNQWFDTAQFESYRMLGWHTVQSICRHRPTASIRDLCITLREGAVSV
ncbi:MAG TPA: patatin-like phospholipase family protein [Vicinamibacterales bacterium]|nr:patatin-like phospholipase family protein [Vicinamibacterales bacterium]